jgi:hypothetical protein
MTKLRRRSGTVYQGLVRMRACGCIGGAIRNRTAVAADPSVFSRRRIAEF